MTEETVRGAPAGVSGPEKGTPEDGVNPRGKWANSMEFILAMVGEINGLGIIWRFPYLCFKNGGGTFLIPYFVLLFFCGVPLFFLETALGQYTSEGGVTAWRKICPMFEGVGIASQVIVAYVNIYYIVILAWALFYLWNSFKSPLPWSTCDHSWNTQLCVSHSSFYANPHLFQPGSNWSFLNNITLPDYGNLTYMNEYEHFSSKSSEEEFWTRNVLRVSPDMSLGMLNWGMVGCLLLAWIICYFCVFKGIKFMGKVVYFTATFPYLMLFILFIRGVTLPGAGMGLKYYLLPDFIRIADANVWFDAACQVFFSYAMCMGVLTSLGSYNKYNNNCYRDCLVLCCVNTATGLFAGLAVFSVLGFMAHDMGQTIEEVASSGPGLAFLAYPKALSLLPASSFWAVFFFLMILILGMHSQMVCVESLATAITDLFPRCLRRPGRREVLVLVIAVVCFLLGLPLLTQGGILLFQLIDNYGPSGISLSLIACFETIAIGWVYGADRFCHNIEDMIGYPPIPVLKYCWLFITPLICVLTLLYELANSNTLVVYGYATGLWGGTLGALLIITPLMCIPAFILISLYRAQVQPNRRVEETNEKMMMGELSTV